MDPLSEYPKTKGAIINQIPTTLLIQEIHTLRIGEANRTRERTPTIMPNQISLLLAAFCI